MNDTFNQIDMFELIDNELSEDWICDSCLYNIKGCCDYNEPLGDYCINGDRYVRKETEQ